MKRKVKKFKELTDKEKVIQTILYILGTIIISEEMYDSEFFTDKKIGIKRIGTQNICNYQFWDGTMKIGSETMIKVGTEKSGDLIVKYNKDGSPRIIAVKIKSKKETEKEKKRLSKEAINRILKKEDLI